MILHGLRKHFIKRKSAHREGAHMIVDLCRYSLWKQDWLLSLPKQEITSKTSSGHQKVSTHV